MKQEPAVVLVRPTEEGNVGAVARAMANTGLDRLILVEPAVAIGATARARAVGASGLLDSARRFDSLGSALEPFRHVVGTTSHRERAFKSRTVAPRDFAQSLAAADRADVALVFGPERSGLTTEELALCATLVRIPTATEMPTLNLAQAVLIVVYELFLAGTAPPSSEFDSPIADSGQLQGLFDHVDSVLRRIEFARSSTYAGVLLDLRRLAGRARLSEREVTILRGLCRRLDHALERGAPVD